MLVPVKMSIQKILLFVLTVTFSEPGFCETRNSFLKSLTEEATYEITRTWDGDPIEPLSDKITLKLSSSIEPPSNVLNLVVLAEAPFYDDPHIPDETPQETMWELWEYEVVELFLLDAKNEHYLEIELSPKGQYLLLELKGSRNSIRVKLPLYEDNYMASINYDTKRWNGKAIIPASYIPSNIDKFNAYAIHGSNASRVYKSLFPTKKNEFDEPNFHLLTHFGDIDFEEILPRESGAANLGGTTLILLTICFCFLVI